VARKIKAKLVLQLCNQGLSRRAIESAQGMSKHSIQAVLDAAELAGLAWADIAELSEAEEYTAFFPVAGSAKACSRSRIRPGCTHSWPG